MIFKCWRSISNLFFNISYKIVVGIASDSEGFGGDNAVSGILVYLKLILLKFIIF